MNIINVGYQSTNYYAIDIKGGKLLVDCGWPGTLPQFSKELKRKGNSIQDIKYLLVTHFHPDHAGMTQELKKLGAKHILLDVQADFVPQMTEFFKTKNHPYIPISTNDSINLQVGESRKFLAEINLQGEIIHTPGHSDDSVTLILDEGFAFTGDLQPAFMLAEDDLISRTSWDKIHEHRIKTLYPGHGNNQEKS
ncbi:MAG: MBL fold metallo-hydrolase [Chloroflexi bacterium]|nr:MBL fold metallo-hydrolase [Chloroflexota bacterium]